MAKKKLNARGRTWAALILVGFVLIGASVIQRRVLGIAQALEIKQMEQRLAAAESRKKKLDSEIELARSLGHLGPIAEQRLGMRGPEETQSVTIPRKQQPRQ